MSKEMRDSMKVIKATQHANRLQGELNQFLRLAQDIYDGVAIDNLAPSQLGDYGLIMQVLHEADRVQMLLNYFLDAENDWIEGELVLQDNGRYCIDGNGYEFSSGSLLQYCDHETGVWYTSRMESRGGEYYVIGHSKGENIEGLRVRVPYQRKLYF